MYNYEPYNYEDFMYNQSPSKDDYNLTNGYTNN